MTCKTTSQEEAHNMLPTQALLSQTIRFLHRFCFLKYPERDMSYEVVIPHANKLLALLNVAASLFQSLLSVGAPNREV